MEKVNEDICKDLRKKKGTDLLGLALGIYESTSSLGKSTGSMYEC